jgi:predicted PurR-regulated permease PerM
MLQDRETRLAFKIILMAAAVVLATCVIIKLAPVISLIVISVFIVYTINPLVNFLIKNQFNPVIAALISSLLILIAVILLFYLLIPGLIAEMRQLISFLTIEFIHDLPKLAAQLEEFDQRFNLELTSAFVEYTNQFVRQVPGNIQLLLRHLTAISLGVVTRIWIMLALVFLVFYLVQDLEKAKQNLTFLFPQIYKENVMHILSTVDLKVGAYIRGTLMKCLFVGLLTWTGLSLLGMPFAIILGIVAGLFNIILYIGPFAAAVPALLLSIMPATPNFFLVVLLYVFVQILDAFLFTPFFLGKATDLSPLTVVVTVLIGAQLMGVLGIILAIPITATLKVLLDYYYLAQRKAEENASSPAP